MPAQTRPPGAFVASKLHFAGPIVRKAVQESAEHVKGDEGVTGDAAVRAESVGADLQETMSVAQRRRAAVPLPDFRPKPPKMPHKFDIVQASWANPAGSWELAATKKRAAFREKWKPIGTTGLPPVPPPPGALMVILVCEWSL